MATGASSTFAAELRAAAEDLVACGSSSTRFVNESEAVLARFRRALVHFTKQNYADEDAVLQSLPSKDRIVHFLMDCARNRFLSWPLIREVKSLLVNDHPSWAKIWRDHVASCKTCQTVDLAYDVKPTPTEKRPIPYLLELLALLGAALPLFALGQGCNCQLRPWLLTLGLLLTLPLAVFEILWYVCRRRMLRCLVRGQYSVGQKPLSANCCWCPSRTLLLDPAPSAKKKGDEEEAFREQGCVSFGEWWCKQPRSKASVTATMQASSGTGSGSESGGSSASESGIARFWPSWLPSGSSSGSESETEPEVLLCLSCDSRGWNARRARLDTDGAISGLPQKGAFDGNNIIFSATGGAGDEVWAKSSCCSLDWIRKTTISLAALGILMAIVAASFHPGIVSQCGPVTNTIPVTTPLEVFFLLDSSGSVSASAFEQEKAATESMIDAFVSVYGEHASEIHAGVGQFSSSPALEVGLTNDLATVKNTVGSMSQKPGGTNMAPALRLCNAQLSAYVPAGTGAQDSYEVCVLITDGTASDLSETNIARLEVINGGRHIMGIYVGSNPADAENLRPITSCGANSAADCQMLATAADFGELQRKASEVAKSITNGLIDETTEVIYECDAPLWTLIGLFCLIPALAWWLYLHCCRCCEPKGHVRKDPQRLKAAGMNEGRPEEDEPTRFSCLQSCSLL